jgi:uncharacterized protein
LTGTLILARIGLLSDSHGRVVTTRLGVQAMLAAGIDLLIHLGDVETVEVIDELVVTQPDNGRPVPVHMVFGNSDWDAKALSDYARQLGITVDHPSGLIELDHGELAFCHGHQGRLLNEALARGVRYLCHGHTHQASDTMSDSTRVINPGALCRAHRYTVAVLDTAEDDLTFLTVDPR